MKSSEYNHKLCTSSLHCQCRCYQTISFQTEFPKFEHHSRLHCLYSRFGTCSAFSYTRAQLAFNGPKNRTTLPKTRNTLFQRNVFELFSFAVFLIFATSPRLQEYPNMCHFPETKKKMAVRNSSVKMWTHFKTKLLH